MYRLPYTQGSGHGQVCDAMAGPSAVWFQQASAEEEGESGLGVEGKAAGVWGSPMPGEKLISTSFSRVCQASPGQKEVQETR